MSMTPTSLVRTLMLASAVVAGLTAAEDSVATARITVPSPEAMADLVGKIPASHPRLFTDAAGFAVLARQITTDQRLAPLAKVLRTTADRLLTEPPLGREMEGRRLLGTSRKAILRLAALGMAWQVTADPRYASRGERELHAVCGFSDWNPSHFLDVAEMSLAVAIGYDWLYAGLSPASREAACQALIHKGLEPSFGKNLGWIDGTNNWTQVCHGGLIAAALAISDQDPSWATRIVPRALANLPRVMAHSFAPAGSYPEGPGYWAYGTTFNVIAIDLLRRAFATDFGLSQQPGFLATADYMAHVHGPTDLPFDYSDSGSGVHILDPAELWFARELGTGWQLAPESDRHLGNERMLALGLIWAAGTAPAAQIKVRPLDYFGDGDKPIATFRSAWNDRNATYLGVAAGSPHESHGHMDEGSFVFDALGVRWAADLGMQNYNQLEQAKVDLWNFSQKSQRWQVLRLNNHGHGTLVINGQLQQVAGFAKITNFTGQTADPGCTVDLSPVYAGQAATVERSFRLPGRRELEVTDHLERLTAAGTVRWQLVTGTTVVIAPDRRHATLSQGEKHLNLSVEAPATATLVVAPAEPVRPFDAPNPGMSILAAEVTAAAGETIDYRVRLVPQAP
jgi:Heparinase II/III-like protein